MNVNFLYTKASTMFDNVLNLVLQAGGYGRYAHAIFNDDVNVHLDPFALAGGRIRRQQGHFQATVWIALGTVVAGVARGNPHHTIRA